MKKINVLLLLSVIAILLGACSVRSDAADLYKQEVPIGVEVNLPESITPNDKVTIQAILTQEGKKLERADYVHFEIWKQDGSMKYPMQEAEALGNGVYQLTANFVKEGLYYFEIHAANKGAIVSPQHQFVVGNLSKSDLEALEQGPKKSKGMSGHHH